MTILLRSPRYGSSGYTLKDYPFVIERGGEILIDTASICARLPLSYEPIHGVTKSALVMFSKCLANEVIKYNIRVNCINPGLIKTPD